MNGRAWLHNAMLTSHSICVFLLGTLLEAVIFYASIHAWATCVALVYQWTTHLDWEASERYRMQQTESTDRLLRLIPFAVIGSTIIGHWILGYRPLITSLLLACFSGLRKAQRAMKAEATASFVENAQPANHHPEPLIPPETTCNQCLLVSEELAQSKTTVEQLQSQIQELNTRIHEMRTATARSEQEGGFTGQQETQGRQVGIIAVHTLADTQNCKPLGQDTNATPEEDRGCSEQAKRDIETQLTIQKLEEETAAMREVRESFEHETTRLGDFLNHRNQQLLQLQQRLDESDSARQQLETDNRTAEERVVSQQREILALEETAVENAKHLRHLEYRNRRLNTSLFSVFSNKWIVAAFIVDIPTPQGDLSNGYKLSFSSELHQVMITEPNSTQTLQFDHVFGPKTKAKDVVAMSNMLVQNTIFDGTNTRNACIIATGFSGCGKSTLIHSIALAAGELLLKGLKNMGIQDLHLTFSNFPIERHNSQQIVSLPETAFPPEYNIRVTEDPITKTIFYVVSSVQALKVVLEQVRDGRPVEKTHLNATSSRTHMKIEMIAKGLKATDDHFPPCLDLYDLAGGEKHDNSTNTKQTTGINLSRTAISTLFTQYQQSNALSDSGYKITKNLKNSLSTSHSASGANVLLLAHANICQPLNHTRPTLAEADNFRKLGQLPSKSRG